MDCSLPGSSVYGILQARIMEWVGCPTPGDLPNPGIKSASLAFPALAGGFFAGSTTWEAHGNKWRPGKCEKQRLCIQSLLYSKVVSTHSLVFQQRLNGRHRSGKPWLWIKCKPPVSTGWGLLAWGSWRWFDHMWGIQYDWSGCMFVFL